MPYRCIVPGCDNYRKTKEEGVRVSYHRLPTDGERCRDWLRAIQNPKYHENAPTSALGNLRVCSLHFAADDYYRDMQAEMMGGTAKNLLKTSAVPAIFGSHGEREPRPKRCRREVKMPSARAEASPSAVSGSTMIPVLKHSSVLATGLSTSSQASSLRACVSTASHSPSLSIFIPTGSPSAASKSLPLAEFRKSLHSDAPAGHLNESDEETNSTSDETTQKDLSQSNTIVNDSCLMELFNKCQTCGKPIKEKEVSHCGAQKKVSWSCLGGHRDSLKKNEAISKIGDSGALPSLSSHKNRCSLSMNSSAAAKQETPSLSHPAHESSCERDKVCQQDGVYLQFDATHGAPEVEGLQDGVEMEVTLDEVKNESVENRESDTDDNVENMTELSVPGTNDSCDEEVYVPLMPQRSTASELLLECEEEELEPWQRQTSQFPLKEEDDVGELSIDQIDCKSDLPPLHKNAVNTVPLQFKAEPQQPAVFKNQGFSVDFPQLTSNTEFISSPQTHRPPDKSLVVVTGQQQLFQRVSPATVSHEAYNVVHTSEVQQISNNPPCFSGVLNRPPDQSNSQVATAVFPPSLYHPKPESTGTAYTK